MEHKISGFSADRSVNEAAPIALRPFSQLQLDGFMATIAPCAVLDRPRRQLSRSASARCAKPY